MPDVPRLQNSPFDTAALIAFRTFNILLETRNPSSVLNLNLSRKIQTLLIDCFSKYIRKKQFNHKYEYTKFTGLCLKGSESINKQLSELILMMLKYLVFGFTYKFHVLNSKWGFDKDLNLLYYIFRHRGICKLGNVLPNEIFFCFPQRLWIKLGHINSAIDGE